MIAIPNGRGGAMDPSGKEIGMDFGEAIPLNKAARKADEARRQGKRAKTPKAFRGSRY